VPADLSEEERATIEELKAEFAKLETEYQQADELPVEADRRLGEIEAALVAFESRSPIFDAGDIPLAGVFVSIDGEGALSVDRAYIRPEDEAVVVGAEAQSAVRSETPDGQEANVPAPRAVITVGGTPVEPDDEEDDAI